MGKKLLHLKPTSIKTSKKSDREYKVLLGLVELFLEMGKPIGSHTLQEQGFHDLSSATIRNYFNQLEKAGYLHQPHASGGRIPTDLAFQFYASQSLSTTYIEKSDELELLKLKETETKDLTPFLHRALEMLSDMTGLAAFLSSPRFDHDFLLEIKLVSIDHHRCLCVLVTNFGIIKTETLFTEKKISAFSLKRIESYFNQRLKSHSDSLPSLTEEELSIATQFYQEVMVRYIVNYSQFSQIEILQTGFSKLLNYVEFNDPLILSNGLSIFENHEQLSHLLHEGASKDSIAFWIGNELGAFAPTASHCAVLTIPYKINFTTVGAMGLLGPTRIPYRKLFGILQTFASNVSDSLTRSLYKFKIQYRQPKVGTPFIGKEESQLIEMSGPMLLEDKSKKTSVRIASL